MFPYRNIAISGLAGTGTTTLLKGLKDTLGPLGWRGYSGGEYMRQFAPNLSNLRHHAATAYGEEVDRQIDMQMRRQLHDEQNLIIESWLAGFLAQGVEGVLKVLIQCSNDLDRAERLAKRDQMQPVEAITEAFKRLDANVGRWSKMYHQEWQDWVVRRGILPPQVRVYFWHPQLYDLTIDSAIYNEDQVIQLVLEKLALPEPVR